MSQESERYRVCLLKLAGYYGLCQCLGTKEYGQTHNVECPKRWIQDALATPSSPLLPVERDFTPEEALAKVQSMFGVNEWTYIAVDPKNGANGEHRCRVCGPVPYYGEGSTFRSAFATADQREGK